MTIEKRLSKRVERRTFRNRNKVRAVNRAGKPRVTVSRSLKNISVQIIDDAQSRTLVGMSSTQLIEAQGDKTAVARILGVEVAKKAKEHNITEVVFDRGSYMYHGRVKALAEGLREGGLQF